MVYFCKRSLKGIHYFGASFLDGEWSDKLDMLTWQIVMTQYTWGNQNYCSFRVASWDFHSVTIGNRNSEMDKETTCLKQSAETHEQTEERGVYELCDLYCKAIWWESLIQNIEFLVTTFLSCKMNEKRRGKGISGRGMVHHIFFPFWPWISHYVQFKDFPGRVASKAMQFGAFFFLCLRMNC